MSREGTARANEGVGVPRSYPVFAQPNSFRVRPNGSEATSATHSFQRYLTMLSCHEIYRIAWPEHVCLQHARSMSRAKVFPTDLGLQQQLVI